jgi:16S rRNA (uracil1498-N3)-methyltransferase
LSTLLFMADRFYVVGQSPLRPGNEVQLSAEESHHLIRVMRQTVGSRLQVFGGGVEAEATLLRVCQGVAVLKIGGIVLSVPGPDVQMHFVIPWIKGGKTEFVVQKLTELGVASIHVFSSHREVARGSIEKVERLRRVALEACKQCERSDLPQIDEAANLKAALETYDIPATQRLLLYEHERGLKFSEAVQNALRAVRDREIVIATGPEGGFSEEEVNDCLGLCMNVGFGPRTLRAETAPLAAAAAALALTGNA